MNKLQDYKELIRINGELDYKCDAGQSYEEMYILSGYVDYIEKLCKKYKIKFNKNEIDTEEYNYIQNKTFEVENYLEKELNLITNEKINKVYNYFSDYLNEIRDEIEPEIYYEMYNMLEEINLNKY